MDRTRGDYHAIRRKGPAGQPAANVLHRVRAIRQSFEIRSGFAHFEVCGLFAGTGEDQMDLHTLAGAQFFEQSPSVNGATRATHADDDSQITSTDVFVPSVPKSPAVDISVRNSEQKQEIRLATHVSRPL